ncbi:MAG: TrkA family potassium uptake protein [Truepera sp.]|nr:TrkA family potassium uptake protein [Truepera sp.]
MKVKQFLVIGLGRFGAALASTLYSLGHEVVAVDSDEAQVEAVMHQATHAAILDASDEAALRKLGVGNFDVVIVAIGESLEANILATVLAKSLGAKHVISRANSELAARVLSKVGADEVLRPEYEMGIRLAQQLATPSIIDAFNLGDEYGVIEIGVGSKLVGRLKNLRLSNRFGVQVIAVNREGKLYISPGADFDLQLGDKIVLIGSNQEIEDFRTHLSS